MSLIFWAQLAAIIVGVLVGIGGVLAAYFLGVRMGWWW